MGAPMQRNTSPPLSRACPEPYSKPQPRPSRSPAHSAQIRVHNRRREYLERHPSYFDSLEHELADPLLYDALIRQFQSAEERETEGRSKGYSRVLEVDLLRGEAKLSQLSESSWDAVAAPACLMVNSRIEDPLNFDLLGTDTWSVQPESKEEGQQRWNDFLRQRFILGRDEDIDYNSIDTDDTYDVMERRDEEDAWFNDEKPEWTNEEKECGTDDNAKLSGETGIQDF